MNAVAFFKSDGLNPGIWTTVVIYVGNACFGFAFDLWFIIFIWSIQALAFTSFFTTDLILVKHFFPPFEAGIYAALSTLGKII